MTPPQSQPESEVAPPTPSAEGSGPRENDMEVDGTEIPVPSDDDELFVFGDEHSWKEETCVLSLEITLCLMVHGHHSRRMPLLRSDL